MRQAIVYEHDFIG